MHKLVQLLLANKLFTLPQKQGGNWTTDCLPTCLSVSLPGPASRLLVPQRRLTRLLTAGEKEEDFLFCLLPSAFFVDRVCSANGSARLSRRKFSDNHCFALDYKFRGKTASGPSVIRSRVDRTTHNQYILKLVSGSKTKQGIITLRRSV